MTATPRSMDPLAPPSARRTALLTALALVAFAGNSVLCRLALGEGSIDAASFSSVRLVTGALTLLAVSAWRRRGAPQVGGDWRSAAALFLYAVPFSYAYATLTTGTGALILFGSVQATMIVSALLGGERPAPLQWAGLAVALAGLGYLVAPAVARPSLLGSASMAVAGIAWGRYSVRGRRSADPLAGTTGNFSRSVPLALVVSLVFAGFAHASLRGLALAVASGALASGLGYVVWYGALRGLSGTRAAVVQLSVPVIAAAGGVVFIGEQITGRLVVAGSMVLGGIALAVGPRR